MSQLKSEEANLRIFVNPEKCKLSGECMRICPRGAISVRGDKAAIDQEKCDLDGICIAACPNGAIHFTNK
jgi:NAD-dependent dihydropyrimidine dehydrogenase PreA subunit